MPDGVTTEPSTDVGSPAATSNETARTLEVPAAEPAPEPAAPEVAEAPEVQPGTVGPHEPALDEKPAEVRARVLSAMADAWTAEAMAAPLPGPSKRLPLGAAVPRPLRTPAYKACRTVTEADCLLFVERLHREAHDAVNAGLRAWREAGRPVTEFPGYRLKNEHLQPPATAEVQPAA